LADISNYRQYSDSFSSSGQPSKQQIPLLADEDFQRIIYLALTSNQTALDTVWIPDTVWYRFIVDTLAHYQLSPDCEACDWDEPEFDNS